MVDIVIYDNDSDYMEKSVAVIEKYFFKEKISYHIDKIDNNSVNRLSGIIRNVISTKIYIVNVSNIMGMEIVSNIRKNDWDSFIILVSDKDIDYKKYINLMIVDNIIKNRRYVRNLTLSLNKILKILMRENALTFRYNYIIYHVPYNQICYIEKEPTIKRCIIHTFGDDYYVTGSINLIKEKLKNGFYQTHQSCIININNVSNVDLSSNVITFRNGMTTNMLTMTAKKKMKEILEYNL